MTIATKINKLVVRHISENPEYGWIESIFALMSTMHSMLYSSDIDEGKRLQLIEKLTAAIKTAPGEENESN